MKKIRILSFIGACLVALFLPFWYFVPVVFLYALFFTPYELLCVTVLIDAQYGEMGTGIWYTYSLTTILIGVGTLYFKPNLRFYS